MKLARILIAAALSGVTIAQAGDLAAPVAPGAAGSATYTITDIYNRLDSGAAGSKTDAFTEPVAGPTVGTGYTLDQVMGKAPAQDAANGAAAADVLDGKSFWGLQSGAGWGPQTGAMTNQGGTNITPDFSAGDHAIPHGYYDGSGFVVKDADLTTGNIRSGANIFGVAGDPNVVNTSSGNASAAHILGGIKAWVDGVEITGTACIGTLNGTRWCDLETGVVVDMTNGLHWLKNASCLGSKKWDEATAAAAGLATGSCGLTDGSVAGAWRLPNKDELYGLANGTEAVRSSSPGAFSGVWGADYWSSTTHADNSDVAWYVSLYDGSQNHFYKQATNNYVLPVREP